MKPLVVLATDSPEPSGLGEHMLTLGATLADRFNVIIACQNDANGMKFLKRAASAGLRVKAIDLNALPNFSAWLRSTSADLLHVHAGIGWEGHDLVRTGKAASLPVVRTEHLPYLLTSVVQQAEYAAMLMSVDRVIAVSRAVFERFLARHSAHPVSVVLNGIAPRPPTTDRLGMRLSLGVLAQDQLILTVGRFTAQKAYPILLAAIPEVLQQQPDAKFLLVGDGPEQSAIAETIQMRNLDHAVTLLGQRDDVPDLLAAADVFVLTSLFEGLPLVLLEAMATGVPVIATAIGGTIEAIGDKHPFLAKPKDSTSLAAGIIKALADPGAAQSAAVAAKLRFERQFQAGRMAQQTADIYAALLVAPFPITQARSA